MKTEISLDVVKHFALDVWDDLTRTRLAGVAVGLGLALIAIAVLVLRPAGPPEIRSAPQYAAAVATPEDRVSFTVPADRPIEMKDVDLSAPRDPFRSLDRLDSSSDADQTLLPVDQAVQDAVLGSPSTAFPSHSSGGGLSVGEYDGASSLQPLHDLSDSADPTESDRVRAELDTDSAPDAPDEPADTPVTDYSYAADIQFGRVDDLKRYARVQRLGLVPSRRLPLLMYLGVSTDHETAVFMVDSRLSQGGEGRCVPKAEQCTFLELRATASQDEHHFRDADGNEYLLRLRRLVRTTASAGSLTGPAVSELPGSPPVVDGAR